MSVIDERGARVIAFPNVVSDENSTTTPLGIGGEFVGQFVDVLPFAEITIAVAADVDGASPNSLFVDWSVDGMTVFPATDTYFIKAGRGGEFGFGPKLRFARVRYKNGAVAQTSFQLQTILRTVRTKPSTHALREARDGNDDAELTISTLQGEDSAGIFRKVRVTDEGGLLTDSASLVMPPGATSVSVIADGDVIGSTGVDMPYTITNGKTLVIRRFSGGAKEGQSGSVVELFEDPNGDLSILNIIEKLYVNGASSQVLLLSSFAGDGIRRIILRRRNLNSTKKEITGRWEGYER